MTAKHKNLVSFHLTGERSDADLKVIDASDFRPALLARYRDLAELRYDFPVVLVDGAEGDGFIRSLTSIVNDILQDVAPQGIDGERIRKHVLRVDLEIRQLVTTGGRGTLSELWDEAEKAVLVADKTDVDALASSLEKARGALNVDGTVVDCSKKSPIDLLAHAWAAVESRRGALEQERLERLSLGLAGILDADHRKSAKGRTAASLKSSVGGEYQDAFDFKVMSKLLTDTAPKTLLPDRRRKRLRAALKTLESQRFFGAEGKGHAFAFSSCADALKAFEKRLPEMVELVKSISIAELELANRYREDKHDAFFKRFDADSLVARDYESFPSYLVCLNQADLKGKEPANLLDALSSSLPFKVVVQSDDILDSSSVGGRYGLAGMARRIASMAVGLGDAFVLQSGVSNLVQMTDKIGYGLGYTGPALFSVFSGAVASVRLPPYLSAAAAMQARAFPAFTYCPAAGADLASRFSIEENPAADADWTVGAFEYEDADLQRIAEDLAFTFVDFVACDTRYSDDFAVVPPSRWDSSMIPVGDYLMGNGSALGSVPYVVMVDANNRVNRLIVSDRLIQAVRRNTERWHALQELGGINNSHARAAVAEAREVWEEEKDLELAELRAQLDVDSAATPAEATPAEAAALVEAVEEPQGPYEEAHIETFRCTTCDECTKRNNKLFVYNENKQAEIGDLGAGTYRQMVESAEACKVAIIHPGKPWNAEEADLEELTKRAEPFNVR